MSFGNFSVVAFHAAKVPTNVFSSTLIFHLTAGYIKLYILTIWLSVIQAYYQYKLKQSSWNQNHNQNCLLVTHQNDNHSPGPSSHQRSKK